jgi:hypothetical protein
MRTPKIFCCPIRAGAPERHEVFATLMKVSHGKVNVQLYLQKFNNKKKLFT